MTEIQERLGHVSQESTQRLIEKNQLPGGTPDFAWTKLFDGLTLPDELD
jgi:hypothetical protein